MSVFQLSRNLRANHFNFDLMDFLRELDNMKKPFITLCDLDICESNGKDLASMLTARVENPTNIKLEIGTPGLGVEVRFANQKVPISSPFFIPALIWLGFDQVGYAKIEVSSSIRCNITHPYFINFFKGRLPSTRPSVSSPTSEPFLNKGHTKAFNLFFAALWSARRFQSPSTFPSVSSFATTPLPCGACTY